MYRFKKWVDFSSNSKHKRIYIYIPLNISKRLIVFAMGKFLLATCGLSKLGHSWTNLPKIILLSIWNRWSSKILRMNMRTLSNGLSFSCSHCLFCKNSIEVSSRPKNSCDLLGLINVFQYAGLFLFTIDNFPFRSHWAINPLAAVRLVPG